MVEEKFKGEKYIEGISKFMDRCAKVNGENVCVKQLPQITWKGRNFTFDYRLQQLREVTDRFSLKFINLNTQENELLAFALQKGDFKLIDANMQDLDYKL